MEIVVISVTLLARFCCKAFADLASGISTLNRLTPIGAAGCV